MKTVAVCVISSACVVAGLVCPRLSEAQVPLIFQSTFNCPEWIQSNGLGDSAVCAAGDGIAGNGSWQTSGGKQDQITTAANFSGGGGGRGFRHWVGDGLNNVGGGITVNFPNAPEIWLRYYIRFQAGFSWGGSIFMKTIYCNRGAPGTFYFGLHQGFVGGHIEDFNVGGGIVNSSVSWSQFQGGSTGDGNFHALEVHAKMNTTAASSDGIFEFWLDGKKIYSNTAISFQQTTTGATFSDCAFGENSNAPSNGGTDVFVDFDDIAVSAVGMIGPIPLVPKPGNLRGQ